MKEIILKTDIESKCCNFDIIVWGHQDRTKSNCIISFLVHSNEIEKLSANMYNYYLEVLKEYEDDGYNYFKKWDEPYPENEDSIKMNACAIKEYFTKSRLWSDYLGEYFHSKLEWQYPPTKVNYTINDFKDCKPIGKEILLSFYAIECHVSE
jgi:hypothetical protein